MKSQENYMGQTGKLYALPFIIVLFVFSVSLERFTSQNGIDNELAFFSDPINLIFLGPAYFVAASLFLLNARKFFLTILSNRIYLFSLFFALSTALISFFPLKVVINFCHYVGMTITIILFIHYLDGDTKKLFQILSIYGVLMIVASVISAIVFPNLGIHPKFDLWRGLTSNPNSLGSITYVTTWIALMSFYFLSGKLFKLMGIVTILGAFFCLYGSNSITSFICSAFVLIAGPVLISMENNAPVKICLKFFFLVIGTTLFLNTVYAFYPEKFGLDQLFTTAGRDATLTGRTSLWEKGIRVFWAKPIFGWGYDSNATVLSKSVISYGQFHNGYLDNAVAGGFTGSIILLFLISKQLILCFKHRKYNFRVAIGFLVLILSILIHNIAEASFFRTTSLLWLMFVFSLYFLTNLRQHDPQQRKQLY